MARLLPLALAVLSAVGLSAAAGSALADQASAGAPAPEFVGCQVTFGENGLTLPSNAPALLVVDSSNKATPTVSAELVSTEGRAPLGAPAKDTHGLLVATLPKAAPGTHSIVTKVACSDGSAEEEKQTSLTLTAPVELPTTVGTLSIRPSATPTGSERILFAPSPSLRAFAAATVVELSVDGSIGNGQRGGLSEEYSVSTGRVCVENGALHREMRTVRISLAAHVAGVADSPAPATLDISVDCGAIRWTTDADFDGSGSTSPSSPTGSSGSTNGAGTSSSASGCSAAPSGLASRSSHVFAAAAGLALLAGLRRRRAR